MPLSKQKPFPCPFCGRGASVTPPVMGRLFWVVCNSGVCGAMGAARSSAGRAIQSWNARSDKAFRAVKALWALEGFRKAARALGRDKAA